LIVKDSWTSFMVEVSGNLLSCSVREDGIASHVLWSHQNRWPDTIQTRSNGSHLHQVCDILDISDNVP
jgi:hypothetical protein